MRAPVALLNLTVMGLSSPTVAADAPPPIEILYRADLDGRLATPACGKPGAAGPPDLAALVGALARRRAEAAARGEGEPIALLGGNQAAPDLFARTLLERGAAGVAELAALLATGKFDAVALGHHELSLPPPVLDALLGALGERGLPVVATNLRCTGARTAVCAATRPALLIQRGGATVATIAVIAVVSPSILAGVPAASREGIALDDPAPAVKAAVRRLRARGATRVLLMAQGPRGARALDEIDALARRLGTEDAPDLILAGGLGADDDGRPMQLMARAWTPPVVGSPAENMDLTSARLAAPAGGERSTPDVATVAAGDGLPDVATAALLAPRIADYCARYGEPVAPAPVSGALTRDAFATYVLEVMRRRARAEIAIVNRGFVRRGPFPIAGTFTRADLYRALPYKAVIGVSRVTGAAVEKALGAALGQPRLAAVGLTGGGAFKVNGRPLDKTRSYRIATIAFVAAGGDGLIEKDALPWRPLPGDPDIRETVETFMRTGEIDGDGVEGDRIVDPGAAFGPPADKRALIVGITDLGLDLLDTAISNGPLYGDAQLTRAKQTSLKGEVSGLLQLRMPAHEADVRLNAKYGWARTQPTGAPAAIAETADLITFAALYSYRGLRAVGPLPRIAIPDPYVRAGIESELTRPEVGALQLRTYHHLELTATAGALFRLTPRLRLRGGAGIRKELVAPDEFGRWRPLLEAGASLDPIALATFGALTTRFEGVADYNFIDPTRIREHQFRGSARISLPLVPLIYLTAGLDVFAVQRQGLGWSASYDTTVGLRIHVDGAHQAL